jgi:hypothetical protein
MLTQTRPLFAEADSQSTQEDFGKRKLSRIDDSTRIALSPIAQDEGEEEVSPQPVGKPASRPQRIADSPEPDGDARPKASQGEVVATSPAASSRGSSPSQGDENIDEADDATQAEAPQNAFDVLRAAQQQPEDQQPVVKKRKKMDANNFILDQADESDEETRLGPNLMGGSFQPDEDEDSDDDGIIEDLVNDEKVDASIKEVQDIAAAALAK